MNILKENNYKKLGKIPNVENPKKVPDIVVYPNIFKSFTPKIKQELKNIENNILLVDDPIFKYTNITILPFTQAIEEIRFAVEKITNSTINACLINVVNNNTVKLHSNVEYDFSLSTVYIGEFPIDIVITSKSYNIENDLMLTNGSLFVKRNNVEKYWTMDIKESNKPYYILTFLNIKKSEKQCTIKSIPQKTKKKLPYDLKKIYLNYKMRIAFANKIKKGISIIHSIPEGNQCFMKDGIKGLSKYINLGKLIGTGDWGNVYSSTLISSKDNRKFAVKMSRITHEDFNDPYTETSSSWYEIWMLKDIIKPIINANICPNLPLFIDTFLCDKCDFVFRKGDNQHPCVINVMELASGDMKNFLRFGFHKDDEIFSALFQVMAGLHAIQMSGQILNNDIKATNILVYDVNPGGYWHYRIDNCDFYVPNYGKMFVINDFGVSTLFSPNYQLYPNKKKQVFNLGTRLAINIDGIFSPIEAKIEFSNNKLQDSKTIKWLSSVDGKSVYKTSKGVRYMIDRKTGQVINSQTMLTNIQKSYLFKKGCSTNPTTWEFFEHPQIIPPFEFYNDVQDVLRMFVGGKRSTQKGNHIMYSSVTPNVQKHINLYLGEAENCTELNFSIHSYHVLAGEFIKKFFTTTYKYTKKPKGKRISYYDMNKCTSYN